MAYTVLDRVYSIFIDVMTGVSSGNGNATFYNTDSHTSYIEVTVTNGVQSFDMTEYNYVLVIDKPNSQTYRNEYTTTDESKLVIEMDSQMLADSGNNKGQLYIMKNINNVAKILTMVEFNYIVKEGNYNELAPESTDHDALYITLRNDVDSILQMIENGEIGGDVDLTGYAKLTGATFTGHVSSPIVSATRYFETPTLVGEGDDSKYYHRVVFGHRNFDKMEFYEYGGLFSFFQNTSGNEDEGRLLFQITPTSVDSSVDLKERGVRVYSPNNKPTAADLGITEDNTIEVVNGTSGAITLSNRMYQMVDATGDIAITLPLMASGERIHKEIHLFYWSDNTHTVTVSSADSSNVLLWESVPTLEANAITEFIFIGKGNAWMCRGITYRQQS